MKKEEKKKTAVMSGQTKKYRIVRTGGKEKKYGGKYGKYGKYGAYYSTYYGTGDK